MIELDGPVGVLGYPHASAAELLVAAEQMSTNGVRNLILFTDPVVEESIDALAGLAPRLQMYGLRAHAIVNATADAEPGADPDEVDWVVEDVVGILHHGARGLLAICGRTFAVCSGPHGTPARADILFSDLEPPALDHAPKRPGDIPATIPPDLAARFEFDARLRAFRPRLTITPGPAFTDDALGYDADLRGFWTRIITLPPIGTESAGIILSDDLNEIATITDAGTSEPLSHPVTDLDDVYTGVWEVITFGSVHIIDLDNGTWERIPGPHATIREPNAGTIRSIRDYRLGECGFVTLHGNDLIDYWWSQSSFIRHLRQVRPATADQ
ncbi:hypothetical protein [Agromyces sp. LHK192]|uniref:hypothetical protein n=1 Tax=Agromyces sp. LHK192 TaxID=2498704 RepID=UPI000FDBD5A1|nr:hypothetical protein [Agromyces sp. LHK192]